MIITSVCLPENLVRRWCKKQRKIMKNALRILRIAMRKYPVRRSVPRQYNRVEGKRIIVTTRFTEAEYDTLHFVAASTRMSVSLLVYWMVQMWLNERRRGRENRFVTNYECNVTIWQQQAGVVTESLLFYPKYPPEDFTFRAEAKLISN